MPNALNITWRRMLWPGLFIGLLVLLFVAFRPAPLLVETVRAGRGPLRVTVDEDGEVRAHDRYVVAAPVTGRLVRTELDEGDRVEEGDVVARLAPAPLSEREREEQTARVLAAEALQREAEENMRHARADFDQARRERRRIEELVKKGFISPQAAERARIAEITAKNDVEAAGFRVESATADARAARAALLVTATSPLVEVHAPVSGSVLRITEKSERVVAAGAPLLTIGDPSKYEIVLDVLTTDAVKVRPGMPMLLESWGGEQILLAKVRLVEPSAFTKVSALGVEEQRVNIIADFVDPPGPLGDGYRVEGRIVVWESDDVLKVPASSLFRQGSAWNLFVVEGGRARRREVEVGHRNALEAEILRGIDAGTEVIRHPSNEIDEGARVINSAHKY
jgi:HlyD family secretion protein